MNDLFLRLRRGLRWLVRLPLRIPYRSRWYSRGLLVWFVAFAIWEFASVGGSLGMIFGGIFAFLAGSQFQEIIGTEPWRKISDGWRDLYFMVSQREKQWADIVKHVTARNGS